MADSEIPTRPDVTEMTAVHRVFRNAFAMAPRLVESVPDGDVQRAGVVGGFYATIVNFLHAHHDGEDVLLFPKLHERASDPALVDRINAQHSLVDTALTAVRASLERWQASGSAADGREVLADLTALEAATVPHLDEEEAEILPIISEHITLEEWGELPGHAMQAMRPDELWLILGLVREQFSDEQKARMDAEMPPPVIEGWRAVGLDAYKGRVAELIGA